MKKWLKENKIFFDVFIALLVGVASIFLSFASFIISREQLRTSEISAEPLFYIEKGLVLSEDTRTYDDEEMKVYNAGSPVLNLRIKSREFVRIVHSKEKPISFIAPTIGYYLAQLDQHQPTGIISIMIGRGNNACAAKLDAATLSDDVKKKYGYVHLTFFSVTNITGVDRLGRAFSVYFRNRDKISEVEGEKFMLLHDKVFPLKHCEMTIDSLMAKEIEVGMFQPIP
jgi:hypothetical protein